MDWSWGAWLMSPGFGGAAAVLAASLAFLGTRLNRRSEERRAREARWWEQARWASDLLLKGDDEQALGIAALAQLVEEAPDVEAAKFAVAALDPIVFPGDEIEVVDGSQDAGGQSGDQQMEEP